MVGPPLPTPRRICAGAALSPPQRQPLWGWPWPVGCPEACAVALGWASGHVLAMSGGGQPLVFGIGGFGANNINLFHFFLVSAVIGWCAVVLALTAFLKGASHQAPSATNPDKTQQIPTNLGRQIPARENLKNPRKSRQHLAFLQQGSPIPKEECLISY